MEGLFKTLQVFNLQIFKMHSIYFDFLYKSRNFSEQLSADAFDTSVTLDYHFLLEEQKRIILILCKRYEWQHRATELTKWIPIKIIRINIICPLNSNNYS